MMRLAFLQSCTSFFFFFCCCELATIQEVLLSLWLPASAQATGSSLDVEHGRSLCSYSWCGNVDISAEKLLPSYNSKLQQNGLLGKFSCIFLCFSLVFSKLFPLQTVGSEGWSFWATKATANATVLKYISSSLFPHRPLFHIVYFSQTKSLSPSSSSPSCLRPHERLVCHDYGNVRVAGRAKLALALRSRVAGLRSREVKTIKKKKKEKRHTEGVRESEKGRKRRRWRGMGRKYFGVETGRPMCFFFSFKALWKTSDTQNSPRRGRIRGQFL